MSWAKAIQWGLQLIGMAESSGGARPSATPPPLPIMSSGKAFANAGKAIPTPTPSSPSHSPLDRLNQLAWGAQNWEATFGKWFPSLINSVTVRVQGKRETPMSTVLHSALSIAFGVIPSVKMSIPAIKIGLDHRNNGVEVTYAYSISGVMGQLLALLSSSKPSGDTTSKLRAIVLNPVSEIGDIKAKDADSLLYDLALAYAGAVHPALPPIIIGSKKLSEYIVGDAKNARELGKRLAEGPLGWTATKTGAAAASPAPPGKSIADKITAEIDKAVGTGGINLIWGSGDINGTVVGGRPPPALAPLTGIYPAPFRDMVDEVFLTKSPADNPQITPYPGTGAFEGYPSTDIAAMVAAALMDPGIRIPTPPRNRPLPGKEEPGVKR